MRDHFTFAIEDLSVSTDKLFDIDDDEDKAIAGFDKKGWIG